MTDKLPPQLLSLFAPRPPLRYLLPADTAPDKRKTPNLGGLAAFLPVLDGYDKDYVPTETAEQQKIKRRSAKEDRLKTQLEEGKEKCSFPLSLVFMIWLGRD